MRKNKVWSIFTTICMFWLISCETQLLPLPTGTRVQTARSAAPEHFVASQGREKIHLSWSATAGAQGYRVYASERLTPTEDSFVQVTYVSASESPSVEIDVLPGSEAWYRVSAILQNGTETVPGESVRATSLAEPEITQIETDAEDATKLTVYWNMSNCRDDTYRSKTSYTITCTSAIDTVTKYVNALDLSETQYTVTGLAAHTSYKVKVSARTDLGDEAESPELTAETLHALQPSAVIALTGSYGNSTSGISLSFVLPEDADMQNKEELTFEKAPLYFTVLRKLSSDGDDAWEVINGGNRISYIADDSGNATWTDTNVPQQGVCYDYKVQSHIDLAQFCASKGISTQNNYSQLRSKYNYMETSSSSFAKTFGWSMANPTFSTKNYEAELSEEDDAVYVSASAGLSFAWNNFLLTSDIQNANLASQYKFLLYENMTPFSCDSEKANSSKLIKIFTSVAAVNEYTRQFNLSDGINGDRGMYTYTMYIVGANEAVPEIDSTEVPALVFTSVTTTPALAVSDNAGTIEDFTVEGGYSDKYVVSWKKQSGYEYTLTYSETQNGVLTASDIEVDISGATENAGTVTYTDKSVPKTKKGVVRTYRLTATTGAASAPISNTSEPKESLGTPEPEFDTARPTYDTITVTWDSVQAAASYVIQLESDAAIDVITEGENANVTAFTDSLGTLRYAYTFSPQQLGERASNAALSGLGNAVTVSALSEHDGEATSGIVQTRTLGPATLGLNTTVAQSYRTITVSWNAVEGANAYQLLRKRWKSNGSGGWESDEDQWESFVVDAETYAVKANGETYAAMSVSYSGGKFILSDIHTDIPEADKESASQMAITQSRIPWGIPIEYMVVPLRSNSDSFNGSQLSSDSLTVEGKRLAYSGLSAFAKKGSAVGYGLNVHADKAEDHEKVRITWDKPYCENVTIVPRLYRRISGTSAAFTQVSEQLIATSVSVDYICTTDEELTKSYEYAVKYRISSINESDFFSQSYFDILSEVTDANGEQSNEGYPFYLNNFTAGNVRADGYEGFTESVDWSNPWNYAMRQNGPEDDGETPAYTIWVKNKNNSSAWFKIASMDTEGNVRLAQEEDWFETTIDAGPSSVTLTPKNVSNESGCNNGLLKVQRDYKHYYMIRAQRKNSEGKTIYTYIGLDESVWTYRRISAEEFAKCVTLILADATHVAGSDDKEISGSQGSYSVSYNYNWKVYFEFKYTLNNYCHKFTSSVGSEAEQNSFLILNSSSIGTGKAYDAKNYYFGESTFTVTGADSTTKNLKSYNGSLTFSAGKDAKETKYRMSGTYTVNDNKYNFPSINESSGDKGRAEFESWFPFLLGGKLSDRSRSSYDSSYPCCNGNWWQVRAGGTESDSFKLEEE